MTDGKSLRNKTIDTPISEELPYIARCIKIKSPITDIHSILDKTIIGDTFSVAPCLPRESVDLIIADPPYNLTKTFCNTTFQKRSKLDYEEYTRRWLSAVEPLLKVTGSIYVCCDWKTSLIIGQVLSDYFHVRNRITWQREKGSC